MKEKIIKISLKKKYNKITTKIAFKKKYNIRKNYY